MAGRALLKKAPPLRPKPWEPDGLDNARVEWLKQLWHGQDDVLRQRDRQVEENIRMLSGQQYLVWNAFLQRWLDVTQWMTDDERRWRQRPVVNRLLYWFTLTHARITETPSIVSFQPATLDRIDAILAEVMDPIYKTIWSQANMDDVIDERTSWMIPAGEVFTISRLDMTRGDLRPRVGPAMLQGQGWGGEPIEMYADAVPYDEAGQPLAQLHPDGSYEVTGEPYMEPEGQLVVDVLAPNQVRREWGAKPWHRKNWHMMYVYASCEDIYDRFGVEVEPEAEPTLGMGNELARITMGSGWFGSMSQRAGSEGVITNFSEGFAGIWTLWQRPSLHDPARKETPESPGGRMMICSKTRCLYDGPREARFKYTSPIRRYGFVRIPGRPSYTSPQEPMNPLQRTYNRGWGQILEYRNLCTNPIGMLDQTAGIKAKDITNRPGLIATVIKRQGVVPFEYVSPPRLGEEVFRSQALLLEEMKDFGSIEGTEGRPPTRDASGELVRELRTNSDRYLAATLRRSVIEDARQVEDWIALLEVNWDMERAITYAGEDQVLNTVIVYPEMFKQGRVNVVPDIESALPEGRGERKVQMLQAYRDGIFGPPGTPQAAKAYLEVFRFPHLGRMGQFGGVDAVTAKRENGKLALGATPDEVPILPWYSHEVHLIVHEEFMKSPEFLELDPIAQLGFQVHWQQHQQLFQEQLAAQVAAQAAAQQVGGGEGEESTSQPPAQQGAAAPAAA